MRKLLFVALYITLTLTTNAQDAKNHYDSAIDAINNQQWGKAEKQINSALEKDSTVWFYYDTKCYILQVEGKLQEAYDLYTEALGRFPENADLYNNRGNYLIELHYYNEAVADLSTALMYADNDTLKKLITTNRAAAKSYLRDFEGAYDDLMLAYIYDSTDRATLINLGAICDEIGKGDETLYYLNKAIELDPTDGFVYINVGYKYQVMGEYENAIEYFDKAAELTPDQGLIYSNRSYNKYLLGDFKGAKKDIEKGIELKADNSYAYWVRALLFIEEGKIDKACEDLGTAVRMGYTVSYGDAVEKLQEEYCR